VKPSGGPFDRLLRSSAPFPLGAGLLHQLRRQLGTRDAERIRLHRQHQLLVHRRRHRRDVYERVVTVGHRLSLRPDPARGPACQASPVTPLLRQSRLEEVLSLLDRLGSMPRQTRAATAVVSRPLRLSCNRCQID
jgi:hypothetical protein